MQNMKDELVELGDELWLRRSLENKLQKSIGERPLKDQVCQKLIKIDI